MLGFGKKKKVAAELDRCELPSFPSAILNILNKLRDPAISTNELATDLENDPGLHVRVLKTVNSAAFGLTHKIGNIRHAVNLLGNSRLEALVLSVAVKDGVSRNSGLAWLNMQKFWATASYRASLARCLAASLHPSLQSDAFTIGLLQNMAIPVLANREQDRYRDIYLRWLEEDEFDLIEQEQQAFGINHAQLGAQMAENWGFPPSLIEGIRNHHGNKEFDSVPLSVKVSALIKGEPQADQSAELIVKAVQRFGIDAQLLTEQIDIALTESRELSAALS